MLDVPGPETPAVAAPGPPKICRRLLLLLALLCLTLFSGLTPTPASAAAQISPGATATADGAEVEPVATRGAKLRRIVWIFLALSVGALVLLVGTVLFLLWRAKQLIEKAIQPSLPRLEGLVERWRTKYPKLSDEALARKLIRRQAHQAGLVGLLTGIGGLPLLPIAIPIDLAATIKIQSNLAHMLRNVHGGRGGSDDISGASLWLITAGSKELTAASSTLIRELLVKSLSKSLLKFVPLVGGVVGYVLNWMSTQALGRLTLKWLERQSDASETPAPAAAAVATTSSEAPDLKPTRKPDSSPEGARG